MFKQKLNLRNVATVTAILAVTAIFSLTTVSCGDGSTSSKKDETSERKLPFKQGSYVQVTKVMGQEIKTTVYFDKWGEWTAIEDKSELEMFGMKIKNDKIKIVKGNTTWDIDLNEKKGTKYENPDVPVNTLEAIAQSMGEQENMEMEEIGTEKHLGFDCKKTRIRYKGEEAELIILTFGNLPMKIEGGMPGMKMEIAIVEINEKTPPASKFEVPEGIEIQE